MRPGPVLVPVLALVAGCSSAPEDAQALAVIDQFHTALNAADWPAINALLSQSARDLRPGGGTARAFRAITARHGAYQDGRPVAVRQGDGRTSITWSARYERGLVTEYFVLKPEAGAVRIESYSDAGPPA